MLKKGQAVLKFISIIATIMILLKICLIFLWPFVAAIIAALIIEPVVEFFMKSGLTRKGSVALSYIVAVVMILFGTYYISKYAYGQINNFIGEVPNILIVIKDKIPYFKDKSIDYQGMKSSFENVINFYREKIVKTLLSTVNGLIYTAVVVIASIFISMDLDNIKASTNKIFPGKFYSTIENIIERFISLMNVEVRLIAASTIQTTIGLYILGVNRPLTIGLICGILDMLPVVGTSMVFIPMILYRLAMKNVFTVIGLILLYILIQISRQIMEAKFVGSNLKVHPFITLFSIYTGIVIYGVWGVFFGPILVIVIKEIYNAYFERSIDFRL